MSSVITSRYNPLLPPSTDTSYARDGTAALRHDDSVTSGPVELVGSCVSIAPVGTMATVDIIVTIRLVAQGSASNHTCAVNFSLNNTCSIALPTAYPYNTKIYEPAGVTGGTILIETSIHVVLNSLNNVAPTDSLYMSKTNTGGAHRVWYQVTGYTLPR